MKKILVVLLMVFSTLLICNPSKALDFDFSGKFTADNDIVLLDFTVGSDSTITIFSSSWVDGGFDPILAIWDSSGDIKAEQDDGHNIGSTLSNGVTYTHGDWDSYFDVFLNAGNYTASIGQYNNFRKGGNLSDGFDHDDNPNFTFDNGWGTASYFNGVWDIENSPDPRTGDWAFHILNVASASGPDSGQEPVPEPATILLLGFGMIGLAGYGRKKFKKS